MPSHPLRLTLASLPFALVACGGGASTTGSGGAGTGTGGSTTTTTTSSSAATSSAASSTTASGTGGAGGATSSSTGTGGMPGCMLNTTQPCYTGPVGTENVGACKGGTQTCGADGTFGMCMDQVLPVAEDCGTPIDDNCNGMANEGCVCTPGMSQPCYGGPMGTADVGICKSGMQTCAGDGSGFGACMGQVLPKVENCLSAADEDCTGMNEACSGAGVWEKRYGDVAAQNAAAVAVHVGGAVITGSFSGSVDFGGGMLTSAGKTDIYVASLDYLGAYVWAKRFGDANDQTGVDVAVDKLGNAIVIGDFAGAIDFGGGVLTSMGKTDVFVAKYDGGGAFVWANRYGDANSQNAGGIAVDDAGDVVITGSFTGKIDFGGGALTSAGATDVFVAKLDGATGNHVWSHGYGDAAAQSGKAVGVDAAGNVVVTGDVAGGVNFGGGTLTSAGATDVFLAGLDPNGAYGWAQIFGNASAQNAGDVAVDDVGNIVVTGNVAGKIDFGGGSLTSAGGTDVYVARFTSAGMHLWSKLYGAAGSENGKSVSVDPFGGIVLTGDFPGSINFGGVALNSAGSTDVFVAKLDPQAGAHVWSHAFGDAAAQSGIGVAGADTAVFVTGNFAGKIDFGLGAMTSAGATDVFLAKLAP